MAKAKPVKGPSTEEKIKAAAHKVFLRKGFGATRTRDVAEEAGINLALLNYYFRSKENLFKVVMQEKIQGLLGTIVPILNDPSSTLEEKIEKVAGSYIEVLLKNPDLPTFVLNEIRKNNFEMLPTTDLGKILAGSPFIQQLRERNKTINPVHFFMSMLGMIVFPFIAKPLLLKLMVPDERTFDALMYERRRLIPVWMKTMLTV